jgi:hypothetical protein
LGCGGDGRHCICAAWSDETIRKGQVSYRIPFARATTASLHQRKLLRLIAFLVIIAAVMNKNIRKGA